MFLPSFAALVLAATTAHAHGINPNHIHKRQATSSSGSAAAGTTTTASGTTATTATAGATGGSVVSVAVSSGVATATAAVSDVPALSALTFGMSTGTTFSPTATFSEGTTPTISGLSDAPALPAFTYSQNVWPTMDKTPPTDSDEVTEWMKELDGVDIPDLEPTIDGSCASDPEFSSDAANRGWWTCGHHTRDTDITVCPDKLTWGVSFDDGPSPYSNKLLNYLEEKDISATFFVVGSRVISYPDMLRQEYMAGHEISVHTWAHPALTKLTNEQIVAELGWTRKAIKDVLGVTPTTMRPPYGDIDDRVRAISLAMGLVPIIWTVANNVAFDTNDWNVAGGTASGAQCVQTFNNLIGNATTIDTGFIVLEHDLYEITVDLAIGYNLETAQNHNPAFTLQPIGQCNKIPTTDLYRETNTNTSFPFTESSTNSSDGSSSGSTSGADSDNSSSRAAVIHVPALMTMSIAGLIAAVAFL
ncbi:hypothetical protein CPB85DRAFT_1224427 [Mucidula mucida]|nr:hypothetical protein CPB85DRAFT_1224427 [Mucidula mucida]